MFTRACPANDNLLLRLVPYAVAGFFIALNVLVTWAWMKLNVMQGLTAVFSWFDAAAPAWWPARLCWWLLTPLLAWGWLWSRRQTGSLAWRRDAVAIAVAVAVIIVVLASLYI